MQIPKKSPIFRIFSANDWNQSESKAFQFHPFLFHIKPSTFSSNAEKLRKFPYPRVNIMILEPSKTVWSNGFTILFPFIREYFTLSTSALVVS